MIRAGHPAKQAEAAAYREQRASKSKVSHRSSKMPENSSHAPGREISGEGGAVRQRHRMGEGEGAMKGENFGVGSMPGTHIVGNHGDHMPHDGMHLADEHRSGPPALDQGKGMMGATAHSHHGPHHHHSDKMSEETRPHHIDGKKHSK
jgi:hypothetical protein